MSGLEARRDELVLRIQLLSDDLGAEKIAESELSVELEAARAALMAMRDDHAAEIAGLMSLQSDAVSKLKTELAGEKWKEATAVAVVDLVGAGIINSTAMAARETCQSPGAGLSGGDSSVEHC